VVDGAATPTERADSTATGPLGQAPIRSRSARLGIARRQPRPAPTDHPKAQRPAQTRVRRKPRPPSGSSQQPGRTAKPGNLLDHRSVNSVLPANRMFCDVRRNLRTPHLSCSGSRRRADRVAQRRSLPQNLSAPMHNPRSALRPLGPPPTPVAPSFEQTLRSYCTIVVAWRL
jgi:hypothetical protein